MVTATKSKTGQTLKRQPPGDGVSIVRERSKSRLPAGIDFPDKPAIRSRRDKPNGGSPGDLNKGAKRLVRGVEPGDCTTADPQIPSSKQRVVTPQQGVAVLKQRDEVSLLQEAYRAFWAGILPQEPRPHA